MGFHACIHLQRDAFGHASMQIVCKLCSLRHFSFIRSNLHFLLLFHLLSSPNSSLSVSAMYKRTLLLLLVVVVFKINVAKNWTKINIILCLYDIFGPNMVVLDFAKNSFFLSVPRNYHNELTRIYNFNYSLRLSAEVKKPSRRFFYDNVLNIHLL